MTENQKKIGILKLNKFYINVHRKDRLEMEFTDC